MREGKATNNDGNWESSDSEKEQRKNDSEYKRKGGDEKS
jgi:hypothetical protein